MCLLFFRYFLMYVCISLFPSCLSMFVLDVCINNLYMINQSKFTYSFVRGSWFRPGIPPTLGKLESAFGEESLPTKSRNHQLSYTLYSVAVCLIFIRLRILKNVNFLLLIPKKWFWYLIFYEPRIL